MSASRTSHEIRQVLLLCTCAALSCQALFALDPDRSLAQYIVARWGARDAFPGGAINAIAQTQDGYLWIGADNGLVRFDGAGFRLFDHGTSPSLPPGPVLGLMVGPDGTPWLRMQSPYLVRYRAGKFEQLYPPEVPPPFTAASQGGATAITRGPRGDTLIATPGVPMRYANGKFTPVFSSGSVRGIPMTMAETEDGDVWVGMRDTGLFCVRDGHGFQVGLPDQKVNVLLPFAGSKLWIGTDSGLMRWDGSAITRSGIPAVLAHSAIVAMAADRDANLWIATPSGVTRLDAGGSVSHWTSESVPGEVHSIFEDREGNLWLGGTEGLMQVRDAPFLTYSGVAGEGASLYLDASGRAWVAPSSGGLLWIRGTEQHAISNLGLERDVIYSITGGPGELWAGRRDGGVTQLREGDGGLQTQTYTTADGLAPGIVSAVMRSRNGSIWAGTLGGAVSRIDNGHITTFTAASGLSGDAVTTILETSDGAIWVGTAGGIEAFRDGRWRKYGGEEGLPPGRVNSLDIDSEGILWIGTASGLWYWSGSRFESARNLPESLLGEIYGVAADNYGNLWVATASQVVSVSRASLLGQSNGPAVVRQFGAADGLPSTHGIRLDHSVVRGPSGRIWFSLQGGVSVVNPAHPSALAPALVTVESVVVDGRQASMAPVVRYPSDGRRIVFNFIGVSLTVPGRVRYRYRLDGYDRDWSQPTESREAGYSSLTPARYTFRVMASNSEGLWNGATASVPLEVEPTLSETTWFRAMMGCLVAAAIFAGYRYRLSRVHAAMNMRFEARLAERTRIARELHDTLLQSFQGLMLRLQVVEDLLPPGHAKEELEQSLQRADQAIGEGRSALYDLRSHATVTNDLAQAVRALGDELATDSTAFRLVVEGSTRDLHPIIRDEFYRITREALRNAFKHSAAQHIETEITFGDRAFLLRIRDDGKGIPANVLESGRPGHYGLSGIRERAQQIGARLEIWSGARAGTEIELSIAGAIAYCAPPGGSLFRLFRKKAG